MGKAKTGQKCLMLVATDRITGDVQYIDPRTEAYDEHIDRIKKKLKADTGEVRMALLMAILPEKPAVVVGTTEYRYEDAIPDPTDFLDMEFGGEA